MSFTISTSGEKRSALEDAKAQYRKARDNAAHYEQAAIDGAFGLVAGAVESASPDASVSVSVSGHVNPDGSGSLSASISVGSPRPADEPVPQNDPVVPMTASSVDPVGAAQDPAVD